MSNSKYGNWTCSGRKWDTRSRGDIADFNRWFKKGRKVWVINHHATNLAGQFEANTCTLHTATGGGLFGNEGKDLLMCFGQVFETQPHGVRDLASPEPDCREEGYRGMRQGRLYGGRLNADSIRAAEKDAQDAADAREKRAAERGNNRGWF